MPQNVKTGSSPKGLLLIHRQKYGQNWLSDTILSIGAFRHLYDKTEVNTMPRTGENIYKRKDGRWEGRYIKGRKGGKAVYGAVYAQTYHEVKKKLDHAKQMVSTSATAGKSVTVSAAGTAWLSDAAAVLKDSSVAKYENILKCHILPSFGDSMLSGITNAQMMDFGNTLLQTGGKDGHGLAKSTVQGIISTMNSIRIHALRCGQEVSFTTECVYIRKDFPGFKVLSLEEEQRLVTWLFEHMSPTSLTIMLCLFTGIRIGEACALTWDHFDFIEGTILVDKTMQRIRVKGSDEKKTEIRITEPKSACSIRKIPIPENICDLLRANHKEGAYVLTGEKNKYTEPRTLQYRFKAILRKCHISDMNFHATRHTFATRCVEQGFDVKCLSEILGHASVTITLNRYVHPSMHLKSENMKKISALFPVTKE